MLILKESRHSLNNLFGKEIRE